MKNVDLLVHAKWVLTCEEQNNILKDHALAVQEGKIVAILPSKMAAQHYQASTIKTCPSHVVMPGFINSHTHMAMNIFRGLADDLELKAWLDQHIWPAESKWVSAEMVYDASLLAMAEMVRSGTVCFNDMYYFLDKVAQAAECVGLRAHIGMTIIDVPTAWAKTADAYFSKAIEFYQQYKGHSFITPTLAPHSTYTVSQKNLIRAKELADAYGLKINIHLQEDKAEIHESLRLYNKRPLQRLEEIGMITPDLIAVHMVQLDDNDMDLLLKHRPAIVHCPESNMKLASGTCPVDKLLKMGINVALGTDGAASNNDLDMITEMRSAALLGKVVAQDPEAVSAETTMKMATINGAKALGIDQVTGSLVPGKSADFIAIDLSEIETQPVYHPLSQVVYAASRNQVTDVWVAGKQLLKARVLQTIDEKEVLAKTEQWRKRIETWYNARLKKKEKPWPSKERYP